MSPTPTGPVEPPPSGADRRAVAAIGGLSVLLCAGDFARRALRG